MSTGSPSAPPVGPARVVVPLDGGPGAERALGPARTVARRIGAELCVVSVAPDSREAQERLVDMRAVTSHNAVGAGASVSVMTSESVAEALAAATAHDLVCMTTHASVHQIESYVGSVTEELLRLSSCPALVVGPKVPVGAGFDIDRIDVAVTADDEWLAALPVALGYGELLRVPVRLVHVVSPGGSPPAWMRSTDACAAVGGHVVLEAETPAAPLASLTGEGALVVMATAGRRGLDRLAQGSVALETVAAARQPVLVVCQPTEGNSS